MAITLEEPISASNAQLVVVKAARPGQVEAEPIKVDSVAAGDHYNVSPGANTEVGISSLEVTSVLKRSLSCLSRLPPLQLEVYKSPSYHIHINTPSRIVEMESFVEECSHATSP